MSANISLSHNVLNVRCVYCGSRPNKKVEICFDYQQPKQQSSEEAEISSSIMRPAKTSTMDSGDKNALYIPVSAVVSS